MKKILLIDNYDSFTHNLKHYLLLSNASVNVCFPDANQLEEKLAGSDAVVISPGPSHPSNAKEVQSIIPKIAPDKPVLGVCLGMQIINEVFGGSTARAPFPVHGKTSEINILSNSGIFQNLPAQINVARYHSLICNAVADEFTITADFEKIPMAIQHRSLPIFGIQFHPESFMSEYGREIIDNFVRLI